MGSGMQPLGCDMACFICSHDCHECVFYVEHYLMNSLTAASREKFMLQRVV